MPAVLPAIASAVWRRTGVSWCFDFSDEKTGRPHWVQSWGGDECKIAQENAGRGPVEWVWIFCVWCTVIKPEGLEKSGSACEKSVDWWGEWEGQIFPGLAGFASENSVHAYYFVLWKCKFWATGTVLGFYISNKLPGNALDHSPLKIAVVDSYREFIFILSDQKSSEIIQQMTSIDYV